MSMPQLEADHAGIRAPRAITPHAATATRLAVLVLVRGLPSAQASGPLLSADQTQQILRAIHEDFPGARTWLVDEDLDKLSDTVVSPVRRASRPVRAPQLPPDPTGPHTLRQAMRQAADAGATVIAIVDPNLLDVEGPLTYARIIRQGLRSMGRRATPTVGRDGTKRGPIWRPRWRTHRGIAPDRQSTAGITLLRVVDLAPILDGLPQAELSAQDQDTALRDPAPSIVGKPDDLRDKRHADRRVRDFSATPRITALARLRAALQRPIAHRRALMAIGGLVALTFLLHVYLIFTTYGALADIESYVIQANALIHGQNVYLATTRYPYPPVWVWVTAATLQVSNLWHLPFDRLIKLPMLISDLGMVYLLYRYAAQRVGDSLLALIPATLYAVNPIALMISAGHGQFDSLVLVFVLWALVVRGRDQDQQSILAALLLGVAIALKGYPVLVLPYLIWTAPPSRKIWTAFFACLPLVFSLTIYTIGYGFAMPMITRILGYGSTNDFGWYFLLPQSPTFALLSSLGRVAILVLALCVPGMALRHRPAAAVTLIFAVFYALTFAMSVQYLLWIVPFIVAAYPLWSLAFTTTGTIAAVSFYVSNFPAALPQGGHVGHFLALFAPYRIFGVAAVIALSAGTALLIICSTQPRYQAWTASWRVFALDG